MTALSLFAISHEFITKYLQVSSERKDRSRLNTLVMAVQNELSVFPCKANSRPQKLVVLIPLAIASSRPRLTSRECGSASTLFCTISSNSRTSS
jgi:hypothetical protein